MRFGPGNLTDPPDAVAPCWPERSTNNLLLTGFKGRTVSYGPSFFPSNYGPGAKRAGHKSKGKKRGSVTYSTDRENEVSKIFIISLLCV